MKNSSLYKLMLTTALGLSLSGCSGSMAGTSKAEGTGVTITNPTDNRTSSDMNISPPNLTTSDPAIKMQDTLTTPKGP